MYLSGCMADRTNINTTMSKVSGSKGVSHSSCVASRTNALHLEVRKTFHVGMLYST